MPQFLSPDVFPEEVQGNSGSIPPAATSAYATAGFSTKGPEGQALLSTSFSQFVTQFGGFSLKSLNAYSVAAYFLNGGNRNWFVRQLHSDAVYATGAIDTNYLIRASGRGVWANGAELTLAGDPSFYDPSTASYSKFSLTVELIDPNSGLLVTSEVFDQLVLDDNTDPNYINTVVNADSEDIFITGGTFGIPAELQPQPFSDVNVGTGNGTQTSFSNNVDLGNYVPLAPGLLTVSVSGTQVAVDNGSGLFVGVSGGPSVSGTVDYSTGDIVLFISPAPGNGLPITVDGVTAPAASVTATLAGGVDGGSVVAADVVGVNLEPLQQGIYALDLVDEEMTLSLADYAGDATTDLALITYAEGRRDILCLICPPQGVNPQQAVNYRRNILKSQSSYGAMYYPWVKIPDPLNNNRPKLMPPGAHVAGRCAFTDIQENVGKAPAGIFRGQLQFISGIERVLSKGDRDTVYPAQINPIRSDASVGTAIWGNKTLQIVGDFTDVNIRRCFINLEKEQYQGLLDIVFEDIGPATFTLITNRLNLYLENKWLLGIIGSGVPAKNQAFKVICDETNNPEAVQITKRIVIDEFIKPNLAAEFIHLRLQRVFDASQV